MAKKTIIVAVLEVLKKYSDEEHRLSQKEILDYVKRDFSTVVDRKAIKRNLLFLIECGYPIEYEISARLDKDGNEQEIYSDFYLIRDFTDSELRLLIDSVLFSKHIPYRQCKRLIEKISGLSSVYFTKKVKHVSNLPETLPSNSDLFPSIELIGEAISRNRQITFEYWEYGTDKRLHPRRDGDGNVKVYQASPYQMVATNGRYYLISCLSKYDSVTHFRMDRIKRVKILNNVMAKPVRTVREFRNGFSLPTHMAEHIYMFGGDNQQVVFQADKSVISDIIDWFGMGVRFFDETEETVKVSVSVNLRAMKYWAMQYGSRVRVLSPYTLVDNIREELSRAMDSYGPKI